VEERIVDSALELCLGHQGEYDTKAAIYEKLGFVLHLQPRVLWHDRPKPFEVYKLMNGSYQLQMGNRSGCQVV